jgi:hypothetical protein
MQDAPDKAVLLDAVARFLAMEVRPALSDPALGFQVLIAANLATIVAAEIRGEDVQDAAQLERLEKLARPEVPVPPLPATKAERYARIRALEAELVERIKGRTLGASEIGAAWAHVKQTLREKLAVVNPRFDLREEAGE